ncbi:transport and golgi organization 11 isoform X2 [Arctopsyche grandis]|uniref:transport and golgi organization 11 isoform X2 n=1 Tax=Arctopsyche grandis TaxID=121162 RepID=UPI00406D6B97
MSGTFSPTRNGTMENGGYIYGSSPPEDISLRMRVPKRIKANGEIVEEDLHGGPNGLTNWDYREKFDMNVPDRIMLLGQDQHIGNTMTFSDVRVNTPPRVITLEQHCFPSAVDLPTPMTPSDTPPSPAIVHRSSLPMTTPMSKSHNNTFNDSRLMFRESTPPVEGLSAAEEVIHLRRQVARINRRVMAIELDALQRQQKERLACAFGIAYIIYKVLAWLNRS